MALYRISTVITGGTGAPYFNRLHFLDPGEPSDPFMTDAQEQVQTFWSSARNLMGTGSVIQVQPEIEVIDEATGNVVSTLVNAQPSLTTSEAGDLLPRMTQGLAQFRTGVYSNGRERRGRMFIPLPTEASNTAGVPNSTYTSFINPLLTTLAGGDPRLAVYSVAKGSAPVSNAALWSRWASLRSRRD